MFVKKRIHQVICDPNNPVVQTREGKLRGLIADETFIFRGVKYADAKRFHAPTPVAPWEGVRDAIVHGAACPEIQTIQPDDQYTVPHVFYPQDEDCQYLNVWTQSLDAQAKRPVMVWLHGGGFSTGSGIEHFAYDGENLSRYGNVVVVTLNHRLNLLGFLDLSMYGEEYKHSANLGMADIVEALRWINANISAFGGDPGNVTIFGQSGGGGKVAALMQIPSAEGLFHRAIIQSGIMPARMEEKKRREKTLPMAERLLLALGIPQGEAKLLETLPYHLLARAVAAMGPMAGMRFSPAADGDFYLGSIFENGPCECAKRVPVIVGNVLGEFHNNFVLTADDGRKNAWNEEKRMRVIRGILGERAEETAEAFRAAYPEKNVADLMFTDPMFRIGALDYARARAKSGCERTYNFVFALEFPLYGGTTPWHNAEIPYVFHNADYIEPSYIPGVTEQLQDAMCSAWVSFAEKGDPNCAAIPRWAPYTGERHETMIFDRAIRSAIGHDESLMRLLPEGGVPLARVKRGQAARLFGGGPRV